MKIKLHTHTSLIAKNNLCDCKGCASRTRATFGKQHKPVAHQIGIGGTIQPKWSSFKSHWFYWKWDKHILGTSTEINAIWVFPLAASLDGKQLCKKGQKFCSISEVQRMTVLLHSWTNLPGVLNINVRSSGYKQSFGGSCICLALQMRISNGLIFQLTVNRVAFINEICGHK